MLRVIRNHRRAAYNAHPSRVRGAAHRTAGLACRRTAHPYLVAGCPARPGIARWSSGERHGYRNAQVDAAGADRHYRALLMDCDTTGDRTGLRAGQVQEAGRRRLLQDRQSLGRPGAASASATTPEQIRGHPDATCSARSRLEGAPHINRESLRARGFTEAESRSGSRQALPSRLRAPSSPSAPGRHRRRRRLRRLGFTPEQWTPARLRPAAPSWASPG
jgi:ribonucleoside-diphosphate reductase alpha chain